MLQCHLQTARPGAGRETHPRDLANIPGWSWTAQPRMQQDQPSPISTQPREAPALPWAAACIEGFTCIEQLKGFMESRSSLSLCSVAGFAEVETTECV